MAAKRPKNRDFGAFFNFFIYFFVQNSLFQKSNFFIQNPENLKKNTVQYQCSIVLNEFIVLLQCSIISNNYCKTNTVCSNVIPHLSINIAGTPNSRLRVSTVFFYSQNSQNAKRKAFSDLWLIIQGFGEVTAGLTSSSTGIRPFLSPVEQQRNSPNMRSC